MLCYWYKCGYIDRVSTRAAAFMRTTSSLKYSSFGSRQSESGKSTILRNLKFYLAPSAFREDRPTWRAAIHLNLVCSVNLILELLPTGSQAEFHDRDGESSRDGVNDLSSYVVDEVKQFRMRLFPLQEVEAILTRKLRVEKRLNGSGKISPGSGHQPAEPAVSSGSGWKAPPASYGLGGRDQMDEIRRVIAACCVDIVSLWGNQAVKSVISGHDKFQQKATTL